MTLIAVIGIALWWNHGLRDWLIRILQPDYRVTAVDAAQQTMTVEGVSEAFVVRCHDLCRNFSAGSKVSMLYRGDNLEYRNHGRAVAFEIIEIRVKPPTVPGGMG